MLKGIVKPQIWVAFAFAVVAMAMIGCGSDNTTPTPVPAPDVAAVVKDAVREVSSELASTQAEIDREEIAQLVDSAVQTAATQAAEEIARMVDSAVQTAATQASPATPTPVPAPDVAAMVRDAVREVSSELASTQAEIDREEIAQLVDSAVQTAATQAAEEIARMVDSAVQTAIALVALATPTAPTTEVPTATPTVQVDGLTRGRLVAASATLPEVYVVDLDTFEVWTLPVTAASGILQGTGGMSPYSWMVHYFDNRVEIVDVGIEFTRHGSHYHFHKTDPEIHPFVMTGPNPAHIVEHGGLVAVFIDGTGEVRLVSEDQLASGEEVEVDTVMANLPHHGVAFEFHGHLLVSRAETVDGMPNINGVVAYAHDDTSTTVHETEATCNNLHGEATLGDYAGFACDEGVLLLHHTHIPTSGFSSAVVPYPDGWNSRAYFLKSHKASPVMVGASGLGMVAVDPYAAALTGHSLPSPAMEFEFEDGEHFLVLAADGNLYRVSVDDFSVEGEPLRLVPPFGETDTADIHVAANRLYALDSRDPSVVAVDLEAWEVLDAGIVLPSAPYPFAFRAVSAVSPDW